MATLVDKSGNIDYFGHLSWGNFFDWLVTFCLGGIIASFAVSLGGVRADTHLVLLPLFVLLLSLHGIWLAVDDEAPKRLSHVPFYFAPFIALTVINVNWLSPTPWLGRIELIYGLEAFIFFWVFVNNVRTRAHLWALFVIALSPAVYALLIGFYQFFQNPSKMAGSLADYPIELSSEFLGRATGSFADPNSFAVFLLVLLPVFLIGGAVPRLPVILRVMCLYVALMFLMALVLTQLYWPLFVIVPMIIVLPFLCFQQWKPRIFLPVLGTVLLLSSVALTTFLHPKFQKSYVKAISPDGEAVRLVLWDGASQLIQDSPVLGVGGGAFATAFEQHPEITFEALVQTPHNDFLQLLTEYGFVGFVLMSLPGIWIVRSGVKRWRAIPSRLRLKDRKGHIMPPEKFFLTIGLASLMAFLLCAFFSFVFYVPSLLLYGVFFLAILVKTSMNRLIKISRSGSARLLYILSALVFALVLYAHVSPLLESQALELQTRQRMEQLIEQRVHVSGNTKLLDSVIFKYEDAVFLDPNNVDAWIGLSAAHCQRFYQAPADFVEIGAAAVAAGKRATDLSHDYALAWSQLGIAYSLSGEIDLARESLTRALELAPNNSQTLYCWAAFLSHFPESRTEALRYVETALEINPNNVAARRLQQKLLIL